MPTDYEKCVREKGKVRTKTLPNGKYMHLCLDKKGKWHEGEVKEKQSWDKNL